MAKILINRFGAHLAGSLLAGSAVVCTAHAQIVDNSPQDSETVEGDSGGLAEIVVTAQKRAQNMQDVPLAVSAVTGAQLAASGIVNTQDLKVSFPGVNIRTTSSTFQPSIRGVGTSSINVENPVALYVDGIYYASQRDAMRDLNDIEQIAVLKGPQGTLFGRNATGGVIQITTQRPSQNFSGHVSASIDNFATLRTDARVNGGITDTLTASLSGSFVDQGDGWGKNVITGKDTFKIYHNWSVRGKLLFQPDSETDILVIADYMDRLDNLGAYFRPYPGTSVPYAGFVPTSGVHDSDANFDARSYFKGGGASMQIDRDLGFGRLTSITAYRKMLGGYRLDADMTPNTFFHIQADKIRGRTLSQEIQLTSNTQSKVNWAFGVFYFYARNALDPLQRFLGGPFAPLPTSFVQQSVFGEETTRSVAPFGQVDFEILPETRVTLGGRWTYEKRVFDGSFQGIRQNGTVVPAIIPPIVNSKNVARKPTWRIALDHRFTPEVLGYISYNRGFKSGGFNIANPANSSYNPESLDAYEGGLKTQLFDNRLRLNGAAFFYQYSNIQVIQFLNGVNTVVNGAKAELYGLDVDFEGRITPELRLSGGVALLNAKFLSFPVSAVSTPLPAGGVRVVSGDVSGNRLPLAEKFTGTLALDYTKDVPFGELNFNATINHHGKYYFEADNVVSQRAYQLVNVGVSWTSSNDRITAGVFVRNLLNKKIIAQAAALPGVGYISTYENPPRTYGVTARVNF